MIPFDAHAVAVQAARAEAYRTGFLWGVVAGATVAFLLMFGGA